MKYFRFFIGDFYASTRSLSNLEKGIYVELQCINFWTERPLPLNETELFALANITKKPDREAARKVLLEFWQRTDEGWKNKEIEEEISSSLKLSEKNRRNRAGRSREDIRSTNERSTKEDPDPEI